MTGRSTKSTIQILWRRFVLTRLAPVDHAKESASVVWTFHQLTHLQCLVVGAPSAIVWLTTTDLTFDWMSATPNAAAVLVTSCHIPYDIQSCFLWRRGRNIMRYAVCTLRRQLSPVLLIGIRVVVKYGPAWPPVYSKEVTKKLGEKKKTIVKFASYHHAATTWDIHTIAFVCSQWLNYELFTTYMLSGNCFGL